jgi:hypothetical protein
MSDPSPNVSSRLPAQALALVAPDLGMERVARVGRARWPLVLAMVCALSAGVAEAVRVDARTSTLSTLEMSGQLKTMSDRQIDDQVTSDERAFVVKKVALSLVQAPLAFVSFLVGLYALSWFLRGRSQGSAMLAVAAAALLPGALADLLSAGSTLMHFSIPPVHDALIPRTLADLGAAVSLPMGPAVSKLLNAVDFFSLWSALLLAFGLQTAAGLPRSRALFGTLSAWVLWRRLTTVALGG